MAVVEFFRGESLTVENLGSVTVISAVHPMGQSNWIDLVINVRKLFRTDGNAGIDCAIQMTLDGQTWKDVPALSLDTAIEGTVHLTSAVAAASVRASATLRLVDGMSTDFAFATLDMIANLTRSAG